MVLFYKNVIMFRISLVEWKKEVSYFAGLLPISSEATKAETVPFVSGKYTPTEVILLNAANPRGSKVHSAYKKHAIITSGLTLRKNPIFGSFSITICTWTVALRTAS